jgi:predicted enzyme related to lactoylglutathione lyase
MPSPSHGWICYLEIPASDVASSSAFYRDAFGWRLREHGDGTVAFDDGSEGRVVSGMWVTDRAPMREPGIIISIMVDDVSAAAARVQECGGEIVRPWDPDGAEKVVWFRDPGGNVVGLYEERRSAAVDPGP